MAQGQYFQTGRVLTIAAGHTLHDAFTGFLPPLLPVLITNLSLSKTEAGLLRVFLQGPSLLQPVIGHVADRVNLRFLGILAPAVTAIVMSLVGIAPNYAALILLLAVAGLSSANFHAILSVAAGKLSGNQLGRGMSFWMFGAELGRALGPIVIVSAIRLLGLVRTPWLMVAGWLGSVLLYVRLREVPFQPSPQQQDLSWQQAMRGMGRFMVPLLGIIVARAFLFQALTTYLPTFLSEEGVDLWLAGTSLTVLEAAGTLGALAGGSLSDRLGRRPMLAASLLTSPLFMLLFLATDSWMRFLALLPLGLTAFSIAPTLLALTQESFPQNPSLANGIYMALTFVTGSVMAVVAGALADLFGLRWTFAVSAVIALLGVPFVWFLPATGGGRESGA
jgi:FSR family fosmidomycin resistance protein-like MFS transporter